MLNPDKILAQASLILEQKGLSSKLSEQAKAVVIALCESVNSALVLEKQAVNKQLNAVKETPSGRMKRPSLEEVKLHGAKIGLPEIECERLFDFYESKGWKVGGQPMKLWTAAMANWKRRFEQPNNGAVTVVMGRELERIMAAMDTIKNSYESHRDMLPDDRKKYETLKTRRDELRKRLNVQF